MTYLQPISLGNGDTLLFYKMLKVSFKNASKQELEMTGTIFCLPLNYGWPI